MYFLVMKTLKSLKTVFGVFKNVKKPVFFRFPQKFIFEITHSPYKKSDIKRSFLGSSQQGLSSNLNVDTVKSRLLIPLPLTAVNSQTPPNLPILVTFLIFQLGKCLKIFLKIALNLYTFLLLEMYIGFRILKTVFESSFTLRIVVTFLIFELEKCLRYFWKLQ